MKKSEFLAAVKGRTITFSWTPGFAPIEKGARHVDGLPESVKEVHPNQAHAWLREEYEPSFEPHPALADEHERVRKIMRKEDETGTELTKEFLDSTEWESWFEDHPTEIFSC